MVCCECNFSEKSCWYVLVVCGIVVPLHPQTRNKGPCGGVQRVSEARRKVVLWHNSIDRNCSTRETSTNRHSEKKWDTRPVRLLYTVLYIQNKIIRKNEKDILQWRVWSWLRMNASYRLNTCKSRGSIIEACFDRWRPAHGCVTRIQSTHGSGIAFRKKD